MERARDWRTVIGLDNIDIDGVYNYAICKLAVSRAEQEARTAEKEFEPPNISKSDDIVKDYDHNEPPDWWPASLGMMSINVRVRSEGHGPQDYPPQTFPPSAHDLGVSQMKKMLTHLCKSIGTPFTGHVRIDFVDAGSQEWISGWSGELEVGVLSDEKNKQDSGFDKKFEWLFKKYEEKDRLMANMFAQSASVIQSAASFANALRGHNPTQPWANGAMGDDSPAWMRFLLEAAEIAGKTFSSGGQISGPQQMGSPYPGQYPQMMPPYTQHVLPGPVAHHGHPVPGALQTVPQVPSDLYGPPPEDGSDFGDILDNSGVSGDYDGFGVTADEILEDDEGYDEQVEEDAIFSMGNEPEDLTQILLKYNLDDVGEALSKYIDHCPDRTAVKSMGMKIAKKVL